MARPAFAEASEGKLVRLYLFLSEDVLYDVAVDVG